LAAETPLKRGVIALGCQLGSSGAGRVRGKGRVVHEMFMCNDIEGVHRVVIHAGTPKDEEIALSNRVMLVVPEPDLKSAVWKKFRQVSRDIAFALGDVEPWSRDQVVSHYTGRLRARYATAATSLELDPINSMDARVSAFVKPEKWDIKTFNTKPPRAIQGRQPRYGLELAKYLKPIEKKLYRLNSRRFPSEMIAKGMNQANRARCIMEKFSQIVDCVVVPIDASKFDAHVSYDQLKVEHSIYKYCCRSKELAKLLQWQLNNVGRTSSGIKYRVRGRRMSGDMNTALGNCLLMVAMSIAMFRQLEITEFDIYDDGDDCLLFVSRKDLPNLLANMGQQYLLMGHEVVAEKPCFVLSDIEFCQTKLVMTTPPQMIRDYRKVLSVATSSQKHFRNDGGFRVLKSTMQCEAVLNAGVPILQAYAHSWLRKLNNTKAAKLAHNESSYVRVMREVDTGIVLTPLGVEINDPKIKPITHEARASFELAFGLEIEQQIVLEAMLAARVNSYDLRCTFPGVDKCPLITTRMDFA